MSEDKRSGMRGGAWRWAALPALALAAAAGGCVSLATYQELQDKYEHVIDAKLDMDREFVEARRQLLTVEDQHAQMGGRISALEDTVASRIQAAVGPLTQEVAKLQADRSASVRERTRDEQAAQDRQRLLLERMEHLAQQVDRLADRLTRAEVVLSRTAAAIRKPPVERAAGEAKPARPASTSAQSVGPQAHEVAAKPDVPKPQDGKTQGSPLGAAAANGTPPPPSVISVPARAEAAPAPLMSGK